MTITYVQVVLKNKKPDLILSKKSDLINVKF